MLSRCCREGVRRSSEYNVTGSDTYTEVLDVVHADSIAKKVQQRILQHASVTVSVIKIGSALSAEQHVSCDIRIGRSGRSTKRSAAVFPPRLQSAAVPICDQPDNVAAFVTEGNVLRENEAVAVEPRWVLGVEGHAVAEQDMSNWCHTHGRTRVAGVGFKRGIDLRWALSVTWCLMSLSVGRARQSSPKHNSFMAGQRSVGGNTYGERPDGVDTLLIEVTVTHDCDVLIEIGDGGVGGKDAS